MTQTTAVQLIILITGAAAIWLSQSVSYNHRRQACLFGLIGQPFWFYTTISSQQWGMVALTTLYTISWCKGAWLYWIKRVES